MPCRTLRCAALTTACAVPLATAAFAPSAARAGYVVDDRAPYTGPTLITSFTMNGDEHGAGDQNAIDHLWGYSTGATGKRLSVFLRKNQNARINVARDVPVTWDGRFDFALDPPQSAVTYGGNTILRFMVCEYVAGAAGVDPLDPATMACGPYGSTHHATSWDVDLVSLAIDEFNADHDRRTMGKLVAPGGLWFAQAWIFDGPDDGGPGTDDVAWSYQNWGLTPPGGYFKSYQVTAQCNGVATGTDFCDAAPFVNVNEAVEGHEFAAVYGGLFASTANRTLIAMRAKVRDELSLLPSVFDALFDDPIVLSIPGAGCSAAHHAAPWPGALAVAAVLAVPALRRRRRPPATR